MYGEDAPARTLMPRQPASPVLVFSRNCRGEGELAVFSFQLFAAVMVLADLQEEPQPTMAELFPDLDSHIAALRVGMNSSFESNALRGLLREAEKVGSFVEDGHRRAHVAISVSDTGALLLSINAD